MTHPGAQDGLARNETIAPLLTSAFLLRSQLVTA